MSLKAAMPAEAANVRQSNYLSVSKVKGARVARCDVGLALVECFVRLHMTRVWPFRGRPSMNNSREGHYKF